MPTRINCWPVAKIKHMRFGLWQTGVSFIPTTCFPMMRNHADLPTTGTMQSAPKMGMFYTTTLPTASSGRTSEILAVKLNRWPLAPTLPTCWPIGLQVREKLLSLMSALIHLKLISHLQIKIHGQLTGVEMDLILAMETLTKISLSIMAHLLQLSILASRILQNLAMMSSQLIFHLIVIGLSQGLRTNMYLFTRGIVLPTLSTTSSTARLSITRTQPILAGFAQAT